MKDNFMKEWYKYEYNARKRGLSAEDMLMECMQNLETKQRNEKFENDRNIKRDKRGRLNRGARLAKKDNCNEAEIWRLHMKGMSAQKIAADMDCSKSTVYNAIKKGKERMKAERTRVQQYEGN